MAIIFQNTTFKIAYSITLAQLLMNFLIYYDIVLRILGFNPEKSID